MIRVNEHTLVAAGAVSIIRVAPARSTSSLPSPLREVQVWCGMNCMVAAGGYHKDDTLGMAKAMTRADELAAAVDAELAGGR